MSDSRPGNFYYRKCDFYTSSIQEIKFHQCTYNIIESALEEIQHVQEWKNKMNQDRQEKMTQEIRNKLGLDNGPIKGKGK